jgi:hypothetical protein
MANPVVVNSGLHVDAVAGVGVTSAQMGRAAQAAFVAHDGAGPRLGVFYEGNPTLLTGTATTAPSMTVQVSGLAFACQKAPAEGVYVGRSPSVVIVDVAAAPASNSRIDVVYAMQRDKNSTTSPDGVSQGEIGVITGTAAVSPTKPAIPAGAVEVGTLTVAAGATKTTDVQVTIATTCQWTVGAGSPIPVRNLTEQNALSAYDGLCAYRLDLHGEKQHNGTSWDIPFADFYRGTGGTIPTGIGTWTVLALPNQVAAEGSLTCSGGSFTVPVQGRYRCTGRVMFPGAAGLTTVGALLAVNGSTVDFDYASAASSGSWPAKVTRTVRLNSGDVVTFSASHNATSALATSTDIHSTWGQVEWIGP